MFRKMLPVVKLERLEVFSCDECAFVSLDKVAMQYHQIVAHFQDFKQEAARLGNGSDADLVASSNKRPGPKRHTIERLKGLVGPKRCRKFEPLEFECVFCDEAFERKDILKEHLQRLHVQPSASASVTESSTIQCCVCALRFDNEAVLVLHLRMVHSLSAAEAKDIVDEQLGRVQQRPDPTEAVRTEADPTKPNKSDEKSFSLDEDFAYEGDLGDLDAPGDDDDDDDFFPALFKPDHEEVPVVDLPVMENPLAAKLCDTSASAVGLPKGSRPGQKIPLTWDRCLICDVALEGTAVDAVSLYKLLHTKSTQCFLCYNVFGAVRLLREHLSRIHCVCVTERKTYFKKETKCSECDMVFTGPIALARHLKNYHHLENLGIA